MAFSKFFLVISVSLFWVFNVAAIYNGTVVGSRDLFLGIELPDHPVYNPSSAGCHHLTEQQPLQLQQETFFNGSSKPSLKLHLKHRPINPAIQISKSQGLIESTHRDITRIQTLHTRIVEKKNQNASSRIDEKAQLAGKPPEPAGKLPPPQLQMMATLESGVSLGSGEYFIDVFLGTPPKHFSLILDTGSDLNWVQCLPCNDCFEQQGPPYDPAESSTFRRVSCRDPRCRYVSSPDPPENCTGDDMPCPYFYWYGDRSNTTGDLSLETFTVNLTSTSSGQSELRVENVLFGCGHWNRGLFHGAAGLLGLGRGPLSFASQLQSLYGHSFSYCLVDRKSDVTVTSKLVFGEDPGLMTHPDLKFTALVNGKDNPVDTFYYVEIKGVMVGGEILDIPAETWQLSPEGAGGTIVDSGTTLSYFAEPAFGIIKEAFSKKVQKDLPVVTDFPVLDPCYNVTGVGNLKLPEFGILFADGTVWNFPVENYFIRLDPELEGVVCLAILGTPRSSLSILGNYQQQNFHILYDTKNSRLGFAPMHCADV